MNDQIAQVEANEQRCPPATEVRRITQRHAAPARRLTSERTPATLRDNGDDEEGITSWLVALRECTNCDTTRVVAVIHPRPGTERYQ